MTPEVFPECNSRFNPPPNLDESQCHTLPAYAGMVLGGSCDGLAQVVVAYRLSLEDIEEIAKTGVIYITMLDGLLPHYLSFNFHDATHPA